MFATLRLRYITDDRAAVSNDSWDTLSLENTTHCSGSSSTAAHRRFASSYSDVPIIICCALHRHNAGNEPCCGAIRAQEDIFISQRKSTLFFIVVLSTSPMTVRCACFISPVKIVNASQFRTTSLLSKNKLGVAQPWWAHTRVTCLARGVTYGFD